MKGILKIGVLLIAFLAFAANDAVAQKIGHINSGYLLSLMPETIAAEKELVAFKDQKEKQLENKVKAFDAKIEALRKEIPTLSPVQAEAKQKKLAEEEQLLYKDRAVGEQEILKKRETLLQPIFDKANAAIKAVATENGFQFILDSGNFNMMLFAEESTDILPLVKAKLGLPADK